MDLNYYYVRNKMSKRRDTLSENNAISVLYNEQVPLVSCESLATRTLQKAFEALLRCIHMSYTSHRLHFEKRETLVYATQVSSIKSRCFDDAIFYVL